MPVITAVLPGSYDPVTTGHLAIIRRASALYERVIVLLAVNENKTYMFDKNERLALLRDAIREIPNVTVDEYDGLLIDYAGACAPCVLVKGVRDSADYAYEAKMAAYNRELSLRKYGVPLETAFFQSTSAEAAISSTLVRTALLSGGDLTGLVPNEALLKSFLKK